MGVRHPGEETLDLSESLDRSDIEFVPVRHEQGGAVIADVIGRLTGRASVALATLGPAPPTWSPGWPAPTWTARRWWC